MILADRDLSTGWVSAADAAEKRYFYLQNWRADTCAITNDVGIVLRHFRYSAYGSRTEVAASNFNRDDLSGTADFYDYLDFVDAQSNSDPRADFNRDGVIDFTDYLDFVDVQSLDGVDLEGGSTRNLYAGYENDPSLEKPAVSSGGDSALVAWESMYHVRHRVYSTELGRWTRRDPIGYRASTMDLYEYCRGKSLVSTDITGLASTRCSSCGDNDIQTPGSNSDEGDPEYTDAEKCQRKFFRDARAAKRAYDNDMENCKYIAGLSFIVGWCGSSTVCGWVKHPAAKALCTAMAAAGLTVGGYYGCWQYIFGQFQNAMANAWDEYDDCMREAYPDTPLPDVPKNPRDIKVPGPNFPDDLIPSGSGAISVF